MATAIEDVLEALYTKVTTGAFNTAVGGRIYFGQAPREATKPYAVMNVISTAFADTFDKGGYDLRAQFTIVTSIDNAVQNVQLADSLRTVLHRATLSVANHAAMTTVEIAPPIGPSIDEGIAWVSFVDYAIRGHES